MEALYKGLEALQSLLPEDKTYAVSNDYTIADIAITPFLARLEVTLKNDLGAYKEGEGKKAWEVYQSDKFAKIRKYFENIKGRASFKATFDEVSFMLFGMVDGRSDILSTGIYNSCVYEEIYRLEGPEASGIAQRTLTLLDFWLSCL